MQSNPIARWHICQGSINSLAFSTDGAYLAAVGRDGKSSESFACIFIIIIVILLLFYVLKAYLSLKQFVDPGYLRVFDYSKEQLICGGKSYYGALLCCAWRLANSFLWD